MIATAVLLAAGWLSLTPARSASLAPSQTPDRPVRILSPLQSSDHCPALPAPNGSAISVDSEQELWEAVNSASPGDTILIADGSYNLASQGYYLWIDTPGITLRSASGIREAVILDDNYQGSETVTVAASDVTIADLTIRRAGTHPIHVVSTDSGDTLNTLIYNVIISDPGQQAIKINPHGARIYFPDQGEIACSRLELSDAGRAKVWEINGSCYTGGVDAHAARDWTIRDNHIAGFWCPQGLSEHGIHLWSGSRDTLVERNTLVDDARGIGFGLLESGAGRTYSDNPCPAAGGYVGHYGGAIRNNFIAAARPELFASQSGFDCGICLAQACAASLLHNSVASTQAPFSSIEWRFANTQVEIRNNLVSHNLRERDGATASLGGNRENAPLVYFTDIPAGDLHLTAQASLAIDQGISLAAGRCDDDIDGDPRPLGAGRDIGADETGAPPLAAVSDLRISAAFSSQGTLTVTLQWSAPDAAEWIMIHYHDSPIDENNWEDSAILTPNLPGAAQTHTVSLSLPARTIYFALKWQDASGAWSPLSNNAFWPRRELYLPLIRN